MKNHSVFIGVDISKLSLDLIGIDKKSSVIINHNMLENKSSAIKKVFKKITILLM